jgi:hypothetical protein
VSRRVFNIAAAASAVLWVVVACCWFMSLALPRPRAFVAPIPTPTTPPVVREHVAGGGMFRLSRVEFSNLKTWTTAPPPFPGAPPLSGFTFRPERPFEIDVPGFRLRHTKLVGRQVASPGAAFVRYTDEWSLEVEFWLPIVLLTILPATWVFITARRRRAARDACPWCGYDLRATPEQCPECGKVIVPAVPLPREDDAPPPPVPRRIGAAERQQIIHRIAGRDTPGRAR